MDVNQGQNSAVSGEDVLPRDPIDRAKAKRPLTPRVVAIVVVYQADRQKLQTLLRALGPQVTLGCMLHNGSKTLSDSLPLEQSGFSVVHLGSNLGVASALNAGFLWASKQEADYVVSFDQDSEPAADMVERLLQACTMLEAQGHQIGAVGAQQIDPHTGRPAPFIAPINGRRRRVIPEPGKPLEVDHLITSGCLIPLKAWRDGGNFLDALFIDYVDIEWCLRLRSQGWKFFGVAQAHLMHSIGTGVRRIGPRQVAWHGPLRHYYVFRNGVYLQKLPHISLAWKLSDLLQLAKKFLFFVMVAQPRTVHLHAMLAGIRDGWRGQLGQSKSTFE